MKIIPAITLVIVFAVLVFAHAGAASFFYPTNPFWPKDHALIKNDTGTYHLFFIRNIFGSGAGLNETDFGHAISNDLITWTDLSSPIQPTGLYSIRTGPAGSWDSGHVWAPHIIRYNGMYYMFYTGVNHTAIGQHNQTIDLATSPDLYTWTKYSGNPVVDCSKFSWANNSDDKYWDCRDPFVIYDEQRSRWMMFYYAMWNGTTWDGKQANYAIVGTANSSDLYNWSDAGPITATAKAYGAAKAESPDVMKYGNKYYLFYVVDRSPSSPTDFVTSMDVGNNNSWTYGGILYSDSGATLAATKIDNFNGTWIATSFSSNFISFYDMKMQNGSPTFRIYPYDYSLPNLTVLPYSSIKKLTSFNLSCNVSVKYDREILNISFYTNTTGVYTLNKTINLREMKPDPNMTLFMHFDNNSDYGESSTLVKDFSGNGNDGILGSKIEFVQGKSGKAIKFINDTNSRVILPPLNLSENSTIEFWFKPLSTTITKGDQRNINRFINKTNSFSVGFDQLQSIVFNNTLTSYSSGSQATLGMWNHVAITTTKSGASLLVYLYLNGGLRASGSFPSLINPNTNSLYIGGSNNELLTGVIDELAIYNRTLPGFPDIYNHYNSGKTKYIANLSLTGLTDGRYSWSCEAYDSNDAVNSSGIMYFTVDTTSPTATITYPINDIGETSTNVLFTANDANGLSECKLEWINQTLDGINITVPNCQNGANNIILDGLAEGQHKIKIFLNDTAGNAANSSQVSFTVNTALPPPSFDETPYYICNNGKAPAFSNNTRISYGYSGYGLNMSHPKSKITYSAAGNINPSEGTIKFYIRPNWAGNDGQEHYIFYAGDIISNITILKNSNNELVFNVAGGGAGYSIKNSTISWNANEWRHVVVSWSNSQMRMFIDGIEIVPSTNIAQPYDVNSILSKDIYIGGAPSKQPSNAIIDDFIILGVTR